ncbi:hypothetical protein [Cypionkella sp. TWP1-2-1b2]
MAALITQPIVQLQHLPHVIDNSETEGFGHPAKTNRSKNKK